MDYQALLSQCNTHLIESDKKRDQVVAYYIAIVGAFFAIVKNNTNGINTFILALAILGFVFSAIIVQYRKWHIRYINSAKIINYLIVTPESKPGQAMNKLYQSIYQDTEVSPTLILPRFRFLRRYFQGIEMITYQAFLVIAFVPLNLVLENINFYFFTNIGWAMCFIINLAIYLIIMNFFSILYLYSDFRKELPFALWVLPRDEEKTLRDILSNSKESSKAKST